MPRTTAGEAAKRRQAVRGLDSTYPQPAGWDETWTAGPAHAAGLRSAVSAGAGMLGWVDVRLGLDGHRTSTPRVIVRLFGLIVLLTVLAFGTSSFAISQMRETIRSIALHTKPAIDAAEQMRTALGAMDVDGGQRFPAGRRGLDRHLAGIRRRCQRPDRRHGQGQRRHCLRRRRSRRAHRSDAI
ncbi:MAG: hypothetical protein WDN69_35345 [Aliidongia sp.]